MAEPDGNEDESRGSAAQQVVKRLFEILDEDYSDAVKERALALFADDIVAHDWAHPGFVANGKHEVFGTFFEPAEVAFSDGVFEVRDLFASENKVLMDITFRAVFSKPYKGLPPHGGPIAYKSRDIYTVEDGKITQMTFATDTLEFAKTLGITDAAFPW